MTVTVIVAVAVTGRLTSACLPVLPRQGVAWPAWGARDLARAACMLAWR